MGNMYKLNYY